MVAFAEEERVAGAVRDFRQANAAADEKDAVLGQVLKRIRPITAVAAVTVHRIEAPGPSWGDVSLEFRYGLGQPVRSAEQELDDVGLSGIPLSGDVIAIIGEVPFLVQIALFEMR